MRSAFGFLALVSLGHAALEWTDWDGLQVCTPLDYKRPTTEKEIVDLVKSAAASKSQIKVVGGGHSFSGIALTTGHMITLDDYNKVMYVNKTAVTVQAGIRLHELNAQLEVRGLSFENLGACSQQSLAGALATGTHGTGNTGSMSTQVLEMRIVSGTGDIIVASATENADVFNAARVGIGALGVISTITINTLPLFKLKRTTTVLALDDLLSSLPQILSKFDRVQWFWFPYNETSATVVTRAITDEPITPGGCWGTDNLGAGVQNPCVDVSYKAMTGR
jgi:L-gulonolactone oxidase